jgi:hypothetical protein
MNDHKREPIVAITDKYISADEGDTVFGKRWGSQIITMDAEQLAALQQGKYLALDVQGEYIVYLQMKGSDGDV